MDPLYIIPYLSPKDMLEYCCVNSCTVSVCNSHKLIDYLLDVYNYDKLLYIVLDTKHVWEHNWSQKQLWYALVNCIQDYNVKQVETILEHVVDINQLYKGTTLLCKACKYGNAEIVRLLLNKGADPNIKNIWQMSPLMESCKANKEEIAKLLLDRKVEVNCKDSYGNSAIIYAVGKSSIKCVELLLSHGADLNDRIEDEFSYLWSYSLLMLATYNESIEVVKCLLSHGARLYIEESLHMARSNYFMDIQQVLIQYMDTSQVTN